MLLRLQIIATGEFLVLGKDGVLTLELNTTLFNDDSDFLGSLSYPFTHSLEPNKAMIRNAHLILTDPSLRQFPVRAWLGALPFKEGLYRFTIENDTINANLFIDASLIINRLKTLTLDHLSDPNRNDQKHFDTVAGFKAYMLTTTTAAPGAEPMVFFPHKNDTAYKMMDAANDGTYPDISFPLSPYFNAWYVHDGISEFLVDEGTQRTYTQSPAIFVVYIMKRIALYLGYTPIGQWLKDAEANRICIQSLVPILSPFVLADYYYFMPAILIPDFFKEIRKFCGILIEFNELDKICIIESLDNLRKTSDVVDLRPYQLQSYRETGTTPDAYTVTQTPDDKDAAYSEDDKKNMPVLTIGDLATAVQTTDIALISATTKMLVEDSPVDPHSHLPVFPDASKWRIPYLSQPILGVAPLDVISSVAPADERTFKLRPLYYHGMVPDDSGLYFYPYGSADNLDQNLRPLTKISLALAPDGASFTALKNYYQFMKNVKPFEMDFILSPQQMISIKANSRVLVHDFNRATVSCFLAQKAADFGSKLELQTKLTLYPDIALNNTAEIIPPENGGVTPPPPDNGLTYASINAENTYSFDQEYPSPSFGNRGDIVVRFFSDAGGTMPKDVTGLVIRIQVITTTDGDSAGRTTANFTQTVTSADDKYVYAPDSPLHVTTGGHSYEYVYTLQVSVLYSIID